VKRAISEKGTYELEEFDGMRMPGTHPGNQLKKFVKREGFYEPVDGKEEEGDDEGNNKRNEEGNRRGTEIEAEIKPTGFEIRLPTLTAAQRNEYVRYEEDEDENWL
jgi:hypothetical protein